MGWTEAERRNSTLDQLLDNNKDDGQHVKQQAWELVPAQMHYQIAQNFCPFAESWSYPSEKITEQTIEYWSMVRLLQPTPFPLDKWCFPPQTYQKKWMTEQGLPKKVSLVGTHVSVGFSQLHECNMPKVLQNKTPQFHV